MATENIRIERDYSDTYSIKELLIEDAIPKYFPDIDPSNLTTGMVGMTAEYVGTVTEDAFNAGSTLLSEVFPTRSKMTTSIYSNAAIFQLTDMFADGGHCDFLLLLAERDIRKNLQQRAGSEYSYFYIDKDTVIRVDGPSKVPFTLDYDIEIKAMYSEHRGKWIYAAKYMVEEYKNTISTITDPYIRVIHYPNGMLVMRLTLRQYTRTYDYAPITDNATLNYPTIKQGFSGQLLGFDALYKNPGESDYNVQLEKRVIYSTPIKDPFCYYKPVNERTFEISFTTKDAYFQPKFNSELKIVKYTTLGKSGDYDYFDGNTYSITKGTKYDYTNSWLIAARATSGCKGGKDRISIDGLKELVIEGFTTAKSITTENDLETYFTNYTHRHDDRLRCIKKRNDAVELLFSAFMFIRKGDYTYPTNTLYFDTNVKLLDYKDGGFYNLDPGFLFTYKGVDAYFIPYYFLLVGGDGEKYDPEGHYYDADGVPDPSQDITLRELNKKILGGFVEETDHAYWKLVGNDGAFYYLYHQDGSLYDDVEPISEDDLALLFSNGEVRYGQVDTGSKSVDFAMDLDAEANDRKNYIAHYEEYKVANDKPDLTFEEYIFNYTFKDYKFDRGIDNRRSIYNTNVEEYAKTVDFLFVNPYITTIARDEGLVSYYQSFINNNTALDYIQENSGQTFVQFITYTINIERNMTNDKRYTITIVTVPSNPPSDYKEMIDVCYDETDESLFIRNNDGNVYPSLDTFNMANLERNNLRMVLMFTFKDLDVGYIELIPTNVDKTTDQITFKSVFSTDDFISASGTIRIAHKCPYCGNIILNSVSNPNNGLTYFCNKCGKEFKEGILNIREMDSLELPITDGIVKLTSLYRDMEKEQLITDNEFVQYDSTYKDYMWTNLYSSINERICLMEPLDMMRSSIEYKDFHVTGVDAFDCEISDLPLLKYTIMSYAENGPVYDDPLVAEDVGKFKYFMDAVKSNYEVLKEAQIFLNGLGINLKYYNSYGRSTNFDIGEDGRLIDTNNIAMYFDIWTYVGTDLLDADRELKAYIKKYVENINSNGTNSLYISNLIKSIENTFAYVHHMRFNRINNYDSSYQAIINKKISLKKLTKEERRRFVPEILVINTNNIYLSFYEDEIG